MPTLTEEEKKEFDKEIEKAEKENDLNDYTIGLFMLSGKTTKQQRTANVIGYIEGLKRGKGIAHSREQKLIEKVVEVLDYEYHASYIGEREGLRKAIEEIRLLKLKK